MDVETASQQLEEMRDVAYQLGMTFGQEALQTADLDRKLALFDAFHKCSAAVRLAIALGLRLMKTPAQAVEAAQTERAEALEAERPDWNERPERLDALRYTERDRESERATLSGLLRTLGGVLTAAEELLPDSPDVPRLRQLLARPEQPPALRPPPSRDLRSRLAGSTTTQVLLRPGWRTPPPRRATGPP